MVTVKPSPRPLTFREYAERYLQKSLPEYISNLIESDLRKVASDMRLKGYIPKDVDFAFTVEIPDVRDAD